MLKIHDKHNVKILNKKRIIIITGHPAPHQGSEEGQCASRSKCIPQET